MNNKIILIIGRSGSGKTTVADLLCERYGLKSVQSYTTRPKRNEHETGHIFVTREEFDQLDNKCAYTLYGDYEYCATTKQVDESDIYVIDNKGLEVFLKTYTGTKIPYIIFLDASEEVAAKRMKMRGDSEENIRFRITTDAANDMKSQYYNAVVNTDVIGAEEIVKLIYKYVIKPGEDVNGESKI